MYYIMFAAEKRQADFISKDAIGVVDLAGDSEQELSIISDAESSAKKPKMQLFREASVDPILR